MFRSRSWLPRHLSLGVPVTVAVLAVSVLAGCTSTSSPRPDPSRPDRGTGSDRPNIVVVLTDDLSSNLVASMPAVQAMQRSGVTLSNHFVVNSLCCPSRASIFTGQYPHNTGVLANEGPDGGYEAFHRRKLDNQTFAVSLQKAGYRTGFMGKYLNGYDPEDGQPRGWDDWFGVNGGGYRGFDYVADDNGQQKKYGDLPNDYLTDVLADRGQSFIDDATSKGGPFFLEVATFAPHRPWTPAPRDAQRFRGIAYPRTPAYDAPMRNAPAWLAARTPLDSRDQRQIQGIYRKRVQAVQAVDALITDLRFTLARRGELRNTYFLFTSDNGYHMGEHRLIPGKQTAFDTDIHVPLVVTGPGITAGSTQAALTSSIDLAPTFERIAGATASGERDGVGLLDVWHGRVPASWQQGVLIEHKGHTTRPGDPDAQSDSAGDPPSYEAVRTATGLYVEYDTGEKEFHDLTTDPDELDNTVATEPASVIRRYAAMLAGLRTCKGARQCQSAAR